MLATTSANITTRIRITPERDSDRKKSENAERGTAVCFTVSINYQLFLF